MKRTVVITGGTKGMGREIALAFGRAGYFVMALYASDENAARLLEEAFSKNEIAGFAIKYDVASDDPDIWKQPCILEAESLTLIHNACAPFAPTPMHQLRWNDFENNLNVAIKGAWSCSMGLIRPMLKCGKGTIINILTSALDGPAPKGFSAYVTAKHGMRGFTLALAAEYAPRGVRILSASPGFMDTTLTEKWDERLRDSIRSASTRITIPTDAAKRLVELAESDSVPGTGEDYPI